MKKIILILVLVLSFNEYSYSFFSSKPDCKMVNFNVENIKLGKCNIKVYKADSYERQVCGMLNFTDDTFLADGMLFTGSEYSDRYFHTMGMKMTIRIMGLKKLDNNTYILNGEAKYSPPEIDTVKITGHAVFETSEKKYNEYIKKCLY